MKKFIVCFLLFLLAQCTFAENTFNNSDVRLEGFLQYNDVADDNEIENAIYLDLEEKKHLKFTEPYSYSYETSKLDKKVDFSPFNAKMEAASKFSTQEYMISPVSQSLYRKNGKLTFGTAYNSYLDNAEINYQTGLFTKYDAKHFSLTAAISKDTGNDFSKYRDKVYIIPELKLTKRLSIVDVIQSDTDRLSSKNEIKLRYTPKFRQDNNLQFEMGIGQSYYENERTKSSLNFSTRIKL